MLRITLLCCVVTMLGQALPQGCPTLGPGGEQTPIERDEISTSATAPESAQTGETVAMSAAVDANSDGGAVSYYWLQTDGPGVQILSATSAQASFVAPSLGEDRVFRFLVTTSNERGDVGRAEVSILVMADPDYGNQADDTANNPVARAGSDQTVAGGTDFTLDGSNSRGNSITYTWRQTTGRTAEIDDPEAERTTVTAPDFIEDGTDSDNTLEFELEVRDSLNRRDTDRVAITLRKPTAADETDPSPRVRIRTSMGDILVELDREKAPISVNNFLDYVDESFYDDTIFHRVIADFVIQGGGFTADLEQKDTHDPITNEADNGLKNSRGTIAMARTSDPNSATSQFYINLVDNEALNHSSSQDGYAVFGKVIEGMSVVDAIGAVATETRDGFSDVPVDTVTIQTIERVATP